MSASPEVPAPGAPTGALGDERWHVVRRERDALAFLGLLARMHRRYDPPIPAPSEPAPTHVAGLNIHAAVVDNSDGEVLGVDQNTIHADESPVQHAEQRALRSAIARIRVKRPRPAGMAVESYYRGLLLSGPGKQPSDFVTRGATLYTTLEPCPMCATTALVCRVKRLVFLLPDKVFGGIWQHAKEKYYKSYELQYEPLALAGPAVPEPRGWVADAAHLHARVLERADRMRSPASAPPAAATGGASVGATVDAAEPRGVRDTHVFDYLGEELATALEILARTGSRDLELVGGDGGANVRTLRDLRVACGLPSDPELRA